MPWSKEKQKAWRIKNKGKLPSLTKSYHNPQELLIKAINYLK